MKIDPEIIAWLLKGDPSIAYQTKRDLMKTSEKELTILRKKIAQEGWGKKFMQARAKNGLWGNGLYLPKWTSTHYTLLDLKNLCFPKGNKEINSSIALVLDTGRGKDGGISYKHKNSDVCVTGMVLNFASYFLGSDKSFNELVDFLLQTQMQDGGWNCNYLKGAIHSSVHSTLSVLEGLFEYKKQGNTYRLNEIKKAEKKGIEFLLVHHLYKSHHTGQIIDPKMLLLSYPSRWRFDILRALDHFQNAKVKYDKRMDDALEVIIKKRNADGTWNLQSKHTGAFHFEMEKVGKPSRWNTLRALRVLKYFER